MLDITKVRAISLDLDDTLWPIWPTIERAERALHEWLADNAPMAAALFSSPSALREIRDYMAANRPDLKNDLSSVRRESIRLALYRAGENPLLAEAAFEAFFAERQRVYMPRSHPLHALRSNPFRARRHPGRAPFHASYQP